MNHMISKIALVLLIGTCLNMRANDVWIKGAASACLLGGSAYALYVIHQDCDNQKKVIEENDRALIEEVKKLIDSGESLDAGIRDRLSKMRMLPDVKLDAIYGYRERDEILYLAQIYNELISAKLRANSGFDENDSKLSGIMLKKKLKQVYADKMRNISRVQRHSWIYCCALFGVSSLVKMVGKQIFG